MAFAPPRRDKEPIITSDVARGLVSELIGGDFYEFLDGTVGNLLGISRGWFLISLFVGLFGVLWYQIPNLPMFAFAWGLGTLPIWLPIAAIGGGWKAWVWYVQANYLSNIKPLLLEVKMPRELVKSPRAMETALSHLWMDSGEVTFMNRKWVGSVRPIWSLEIVSFGGDVRFYIWTWETWRSTVEAAIYSQYPEVELVEAEDYASKFVYDPKEKTVFATDFRYEPRNDAYPIKTYIDFELEKDPKEEYKVDPLATILEHLSNLRPDEQIWLQIVFTSNKDWRRKRGGKWYETEGRYTGLLQETIDTIRKETVGKLESPGEEWRRWVRIQQFRQTELIRSIDRNMGKHPFNVGVRGVYMSDPDKFTSAGWKPLHMMYRPVGNPQWANQLRPRRWHTPFDYPYQDLWDIRFNIHAERFFDCYRRRQHFYSPYPLPHNMMSTEIIATIWHPVSSGVKTPGIQRIPAKKAEAPPNLPK